MCSGIRLPRHGQGHDQQEERQFSGPRLRLPIGWRHAHLALERTIEIHPSGKPGLQGKGVERVVLEPSRLNEPCGFSHAILVDVGLEVDTLTMVDGHRHHTMALAA